ATLLDKMQILIQDQPKQDFDPSPAHRSQPWSAAQMATPDADKRPVELRRLSATARSTTQTSRPTPVQYQHHTSRRAPVGLHRRLHLLCAFGGRVPRCRLRLLRVWTFQVFGVMTDAVVLLFVSQP